MDMSSWSEIEEHSYIFEEKDWIKIKIELELEKHLTSGSPFGPCDWNF
jgi:hypothetical protein